MRWWGGGGADGREGRVAPLKVRNLTSTGIFPPPAAELRSWFGSWGGGGGRGGAGAGSAPAGPLSSPHGAPSPAPRGRRDGSVPAAATHHFLPVAAAVCVSPLLLVNIKAHSVAVHDGGRRALIFLGGFLKEIWLHSPKVRGC